MELPACGLYRTTEEIGQIPPGRLVYFHNHGDPGPGVYLPEAWAFNRATFSKNGTTLSAENLAFTLEAVAPEGLYRVTEEFTCCEKNCRTFAEGLLVQLGYNNEAAPILFVPEWTESGLGFPQMGSMLDGSWSERLQLIKVASSKPAATDEHGETAAH